MHFVRLHILIMKVYGVRTKNEIVERIYVNIIHYSKFDLSCTNCSHSLLDKVSLNLSLGFEF